MPFSVVILTFNEEDNLPRCLGALPWCDDIVVVDSYSTDSTVEIALRAGARVVQNKFEDFGQQRTFAMENVAYRHEWVLHLDADEVCTDELRSEIELKIPDPGYDAYWIPSKLIYLGQWLKHAGMYPVYQVRLGRKGVLRYARYGHTQLCTIDALRIGRLTQPYLHYNFSKGLANWFEKHNRYSTLEAIDQVSQQSARQPNGHLVSALWDPISRRQMLKRLSKKLPFRPFFRFFYVYVLCLGFLDGRAGWAYSWMLAYYEFMIGEKIRELKIGATNQSNAPKNMIMRAGSKRE